MMGPTHTHTHTKFGNYIGYKIYKQWPAKQLWKDVFKLRPFLNMMLLSNDYKIATARCCPTKMDRQTDIRKLHV